MKKKSKQPPSKVTVLAELTRVAEKAGIGYAEVTRDFFRANGRVGDKWNLYWPSFKAFVAAWTTAAEAGDDLYYKVLVELTSTRRK
jgi:hypothetical protein